LGCTVGAALAVSVGGMGFCTNFFALHACNAIIANNRRTGKKPDFIDFMSEYSFANEDLIYSKGPASSGDLWSGKCSGRWQKKPSAQKLI
jgi:hypothetical protein